MLEGKHVGPVAEMTCVELGVAGAPLDQLRGMSNRGAFWQDPEKARWAKRKLWWHDNRGLAAGLHIYSVACPVGRGARSAEGRTLILVNRSLVE
jgi:hypothetical protein